VGLSYYVEVGSIYAHFLESFYYKLMLNNIPLHTYTTPSCIISLMNTDTKILNKILAV